MFKVKVCGITNSLDARAAIEFGADAIGLNFYERSLRSVTVEQAKSLVEKLELPVFKVGVFVDRHASEVNSIAQECHLDAVQLHGQQTPEFVQQLERTRFRLIRALPWNGLQPTQRSVDEWREAGAEAILLDAQRGKQFGGTGQTIDWQAASQLESDVDLVLAGGLTPENVQQAVLTSRIAHVDTASGIESLPGKKDHELMKDFVCNALDAIARLDGKHSA